MARLTWQRNRYREMDLKRGREVLLTVFQIDGDKRWRVHLGEHGSPEQDPYSWLRARSEQAACAEGYRLWRKQLTEELNVLARLLRAAAPALPATRKAVRS